MPMSEQFKRWKLIMLTLHQKQKINREQIDILYEIQSGAMLNKYEVTSDFFFNELLCLLRYLIF